MLDVDGRRVKKERLNVKSTHTTRQHPAQPVSVCDSSVLERNTPGMCHTHKLLLITVLTNLRHISETTPVDCYAASNRVLATAVRGTRPIVSTTDCIPQPAKKKSHSWYELHIVCRHKTQKRACNDRKKASGQDGAGGEKPSPAQRSTPIIPLLRGTIVNRTYGIHKNLYI